MKRIVSVSRRTDVPAFYADWFLNRLDAGFAGWENPFSARKYLVSLKRDDVLAFVFWSKNFRPFLPALERVKALGYPVLLHYTITGLPRAFECGAPETDDAIESLHALSRLFSPAHVVWRYDPIVFSRATDAPCHLRRFEELATRLEGAVERCVFSFAAMYGKVRRNFAAFEAVHDAGFRDPDTPERVELANRLAAVAAAHGMTLHSCCGDVLLNGQIRKAHCVDGELLARLYPGEIGPVAEKPTRKECGCYESADIGRYDTCPHGCLYCYATVNKPQADKAWHAHDKDSAFLGVPKAAADRFVAEVTPR